MNKWKIVLLMICCFLLGLSVGSPFDSTDKPPFRSGMVLYHDYMTGCDYLSDSNHQLFPRLNPNGSQVCHKAN